MEHRRPSAGDAFTQTRTLLIAPPKLFSFLFLSSFSSFFSLLYSLKIQHPKIGRSRNWPKSSSPNSTKKAGLHHDPMKQAQPLGQKMDQARARFRCAVVSGEKAMQALHKPLENFEQAQQEVARPRQTWRCSCRKPVAGHASSTSQREPGQSKTCGPQTQANHWST